MQPSQNNLVTEIILGILASLLIIAGAVLLYLRIIDATFATLLFGSALGLFGFNQAFKAPSPTQQVQLNAQQQNLQQLVSYALSMLPQLVQSLQSQPIPAQVLQTAPPQAQQTAQPVQVQSPVAAPVVPPVASPAVIPSVVPPEANSVPGMPPVQTQFRTISIPDVSMPLNAVGQGIPLGQ